MKNLLIAIVIGFVLMSSFAYLAENWFEIQVTLAEEVLSPLQALSLLGLITCILVVVGFVIAISVFGALVIAIIASLFGIFVAGVGVFWPVLVAAVVLIYLMRDKSRVAH